MGRLIKFENEDGNIEQLTIDRFPDFCAVCSKGIDPIIMAAYGKYTYSKYDGLLQAVFRCPLRDCQKIFVAYYTSGGSVGSNYYWQKSRLPFPVDEQHFEVDIENLSPNFVRIFNQAKFAEENGLDQVCGSGYRRALEFLIKDYLIYLNPKKKEIIKNKFLGNIIKEDIDDQKIKTTAERAAWLGNDESHYIRMWEDKDLENLKHLIKLTTYWVAGSVSTAKYEAEMPSSRNT